VFDVSAGARRLSRQKLSASVQKGELGRGGRGENSCGRFLIFYTSHQGIGDGDPGDTIWGGRGTMAINTKTEGTKIRQTAGLNS